MAKPTPHQKVEAALTAYGLTFPEATAGLWIPPARQLLVKGKTFCIFGAKNEPLDELTLVLKLPLSAEMVQDLYYVREAKGWYKQHNWVTAHFDPGDDIAAEIDTLKAWLLQSWRAIAPKRLVKGFG
ncbi:hypothetical protein sos41_26960 [Alphaproteobacteria bacterium SO-S41]|nr:hypothetical protein sos41_26960 [Alphaproteobacteria bacterium SO-S41]